MLKSNHLLDYIAKDQSKKEGKLQWKQLRKDEFKHRKEWDHEISKQRHKWAANSTFSKCHSPPPYLQDGNDDSKKTDGATKDLDYEDLDKERRILGICQCRSRTDNSNTDSTKQIGKSNGQTSTKHWKPLKNKHIDEMQSIDLAVSHSHTPTQSFIWASSTIFPQKLLSRLQ